MSGPNPTRLERPFLIACGCHGDTTDVEHALQLVDLNRHVDCVTYDHCLTKAAVKAWPGFSCQTCMAYVPEPPPKADETPNHEEFVW